MTKLNPSFDLHYDLKSLGALDAFVQQFDNPKHIMQLMVLEIRALNNKVDDLNHSVEAKKGVIAAQKAVIADQLSRLDGLTPDPESEHIGEVRPRVFYPGGSDMNKPDESIIKSDLNKLEERVLAQDPNATFCRACGASIPHRYGEGRCHLCEHHNDEYLLEKEPMVIPYEPSRDDAADMFHGNDKSIKDNEHY